MDPSPLRVPRLACAAWLAWSLLVLGAVAAAWVRIPAIWLPFAAACAAGALSLGFSKPLPGLRLLVVLLPLFDSVPAQAPTGWFPPIALLWHFYFAGWLAARILRGDARMPRAWIVPALGAWCALAMASAAVSMARYARFWPFAAEPFFVFHVNGLGETNVDAIKGIFAWLALFLMGPAVAWVAACLHRDAASRIGTFSAAAVGLGASMVFGLWQSMGHEWTNNTEHFARLGQINATFLDPNALGSWVMLAIPMLAALAWQVRESPARLVLAVLATLALYVLLESGSRTGILGLMIGASIASGFAIVRWVPAHRRRFALGAAAGATVLLVACAALLTTLLRETSLGIRVAGTLARAKETGLAGALLSDRAGLWHRALVVSREHPFSGIGLGTYLTEIPNFMGVGEGEPFYRDNAASFYLQWLAEAGIAGLVLSTAVVLLVVVQWARAAWQVEGEDRHLALATAGVPAMVVLYIVGSHTNPAEVQILFWLQVGLLFANARGNVSAAKTGRAAILALAVVALNAGVLLRSGTTTLSPRAMQQRGRLFDMRGGFHPPETDSGGRGVRWTKRRAFVMTPKLGGEMKCDVYIGHPDAGERPVRFRAWLEGIPIADWAFSEPGSRELRFAMPADSESAELRLEVDRTWVPSEALAGNSDARELGVMVGGFTAVEDGQ